MYNVTLAIVHHIPMIVDDINLNSRHNRDSGKFPVAIKPEPTVPNNCQDAKGKVGSTCARMKLNNGVHDTLSTNEQ